MKLLARLILLRLLPVAYITPVLLLLLTHLKWLLKTFYRLLRRSISLSLHYIHVVTTSPSCQRLIVFLDALQERPQIRDCRNLLYHFAAFIIGSKFEDERVAFSASELVKNDAYRDRLLVPEIEDLVALCEALKMTLAQQKAYFLCFRHVDYMRSSTVSRAELLRYCNLRAAPVTTFLLPNAEPATHRPSARNRWDILQLMAVCFSVCTAEIPELVQIAVAEACQPVENKVEESDEDESTIEQAEQKGAAENGMPAEELTLCQQIDRCSSFFIGVPDPIERNLLSLLALLYDDTGDDKDRRVDFRKAHSVTTIFDVVRLFPVLIFPCIWTQRVLRTRILGMKTWQCLHQRRCQLQPHIQTDKLLLSVADIIAASQVYLQEKNDKNIVEPTIMKTWEEKNSSAALLDSVNSSRSTPRKIVPSAGSERPKSDVESSMTFQEVCDSRLKLTFDQCATFEDAWRISANNAVASVSMLCSHPEHSDEKLSEEFHQVTEEIVTGDFSVDTSERVRQRLVKDYGYRFAQALLAKSNVKELSCASKTPLDERRAKHRFAKANRECRLVEDKGIYWKEFEDPVAKRAFYYNVRTGESRWEKPPNFVGKKKVRRRRKANNHTDGQESGTSA